MLYKETKEIGLDRFDNYNLQFNLFLSKLIMPEFHVNPKKALCFTTDPLMLSIDLDGNVLPCQTFEKNFIFENGDKALCGNIDNIKSVKRPKIHGINERKTCYNCPVVSFCMGGCPYAINEAHYIDCRVKYHHYMAFLMLYLEMILHKQLIEIRDV